MIQLVILGLSILSTLAGVSTLVTGKIAITKGSSMQGPVARAVGVGLLVVAAAMAIFAEVILPHLK